MYQWSDFGNRQDRQRLALALALAGTWWFHRSTGNGKQCFFWIYLYIEGCDITTMMTDDENMTATSSTRLLAAHGEVVIM
jgi:hypothetical protein